MAKHNGRLAVTGVTSGREPTPPSVDETARRPGQVRTVLAEAPLRARVTCALMAYSGVCPEVVGNNLGDEGSPSGFPQSRPLGERAQFAGSRPRDRP